MDQPCSDATPSRAGRSRATPFYPHAGWDWPAPAAAGRPGRARLPPAVQHADDRTRAQRHLMQAAEIALDPGAGQPQTGAQIRDHAHQPEPQATLAEHLRPTIYLRTAPPLTAGAPAFPDALLDHLDGGRWWHRPHLAGGVQAASTYAIGAVGTAVKGRGAPAGWRLAAARALRRRGALPAWLGRCRTRGARGRDEGRWVTTPLLQFGDPCERDGSLLPQRRIFRPHGRNVFLERHTLSSAEPPAKTIVNSYLHQGNRIFYLEHFE